MTDKPINYAYLYGTLQGVLVTLPYTLALAGVIKFDPGATEAVRSIAVAAMEKAKKSEREYTTGTLLG